MLKLAIPSIIGSLIFFFQQSINVYFVSHLNDKGLVSSVGLGNMIQNTFIVSIITSYNAVLETFVSQSVGSGNYSICGLYLNRGIVVMTLVFSLCSVVFIWNCDVILMRLGQDESVIHNTKMFLTYQIPAIYLYGLCDLYRRFICCFKKNTLPMFSFLISTSLHPFWCQKFVVEQGHGLGGLPVAGLITNATTFILMQFFWLCDAQLVATSQASPRLLSHQTFSSLSSYISIGVPNMLAQMVSCFCLEQMTLGAGLLGITQQASQVILTNMTMFAFMVSYGMQSPGCTLVGQAIGACDIARAKGYFWALIYVFSGIVTLEIAVFYTFKDDIVGSLTKFNEMKECITRIFPLFLTNIIFAGFNGTLRGPIFALALMKDLTKYNLMFQGLAMPILSYYFIVRHHFGMHGIWLAKNIVEFLLCLSYSLKLASINWHAIAHSFMKKRIADSQVAERVTFGGADEQARE